MSFRDDWPEMPDGSTFDGNQLLTLVRSGNSPMSRVWDVNLLVREVEEVLGSEVIDIPTVTKGSNNYVSVPAFYLHNKVPFTLESKLTTAKGFHIKLLNGSDILARLARGDVNMPNYEGFPMHVQISEAQFEVAVYKLLCPLSQILASHLLYHRLPVQYPAPRLHLPQDIACRRLFLFKRAQGENNIWHDLSEEQRVRASAIASLNSTHVCRPTV